MKWNILPFKNIFQDEGVFLRLHFIICAFGLIGVIRKFSQLLGVFLAQHLNEKIVYNNWAKIWLDASKPSQLLEYLLPIVFLCLYFLVVYCLLERKITVK